MSHVVLIHFLGYFHLHSVITWSDGQHVPLDLVKLRVTLEVVETSKIHKDHEDTHAGDLGGHLVLLLKLLLVLLACKANKDAGIFVCALSGSGSFVGMAISTEERLLSERVHEGSLSLVSLILCFVLAYNICIDAGNNAAL